MRAIEQSMTVTSVERSDDYGWEDDNGTRQVESEYSRDDVLELKEKRRLLDDYVDGVVRELDTRRLQDQQNEKNKLELAVRRDDDDRINRVLEELERMKREKREAREKEDNALRRMKYSNIPSTVSFQNGKHLRGENKSDHRKKSKWNKAEAKVSPDKSELLIDLTTDDQDDSKTDSSQLIPKDEISKEEKRRKQVLRDERNSETFAQCRALKAEYARYYPHCKIPNYHLPWRFVNDLRAGHTFKNWEHNTPVNIKDEEIWNKEWCTVKKKYI